MEVVNLAEKTEAQKRAQKNYMEKFARVELRMDCNLRDNIKAAANAAGESLNGYITKAISQRMERDTIKGG